MAQLHHRYAELEALIQQNTTTLSRQETEQLERAAFLSEACLFAEAAAIFEGFDECTRLEQPPVAIEYALLLLRQAKYAPAHQHLEQVLRRAEADGRLAADRLLQPEYRILRILLARAEVWTVGSFRRAKESMDEIRVWLKGVAVEDCTNLHVISIFFSIFYFPILYLTSLLKSLNPISTPLFPLSITYLFPLFIYTLFLPLFPFLFRGEAYSSPNTDPVHPGVCIAGQMRRSHLVRVRCQTLWRYSEVSGAQRWRIKAVAIPHTPARVLARPRADK